MGQNVRVSKLIFYRIAAHFIDEKISNNPI